MVTQSRRMFRMPVRIAALLALLTLTAVADGGAPQTFSRSAWITAQRRWARFDGGLEPPTAGARAELLQTLAGRSNRRPRPTPGGPPNLRISEDILEADLASAAQPETEAEPSLAADPGDEGHLVAGYQEDRFEDGGARALTVATSFDTGQHWQEGLLPNLTRTAGGPFLLVVIHAWSTTPSGGRPSTTTGGYSGVPNGIGPEAFPTTTSS